jgi:hypothetical protein
MAIFFCGKATLGLLLCSDEIFVICLIMDVFGFRDRTKGVGKDAGKVSETIVVTLQVFSP